MAKEEEAQPVLRVPFDWFERPPHLRRRRPLGTPESPYQVTITLGLLNGRMECVGVSVEARDNAHVGSGSLLREIPVASLTTEAVQIASDIHAEVSLGPGLPLNWPDMDEEWRESWLQFHESEIRNEDAVR